MGSVWTFVLLWGVWLITPVLIDGVDTLVRLIVVLSHKPSLQLRRLSGIQRLPMISVIVPAYNEAAVIDRCLESIKSQDYPHDRLEIIVVDDGSTDGTPEIVEEHIAVCLAGFESRDDIEPGVCTRNIRLGRFGGVLTLIRNDHGGKAHALNVGIAMCQGDIVLNIDSDVTLAPEAIRAVAEAFRRDPSMGAATGNIEVDWDMVEARDENGHVLVDEEGRVIARRLNWFELFLARCQYLEYLASFRLGRQAQAYTNTMFTLAGACSAFRREVLPPNPYSRRTVSEDTDLTLHLHTDLVRIGFIPGCKVFLEPVVDWDGMYAQRVRWTRGQLEVCGVHDRLIGSHEHGLLGRIALRQILLFDHTFAFPRLVWMPLLLLFPILGYRPSMLVAALGAMYVFYVAMEIVTALSCYSISDDPTKRRLEQSSWAILAMPLYRFIVFHFRFSGFLVTLKEEQSWSVQGPMAQQRESLSSLRLRSLELATMLLRILSPLVALTRSAWILIMPALAAMAAYFSSPRKGA